MCHLYPLPEQAQNDPMALCPESAGLAELTSTFKIDLNKKLRETCSEVPEIQFVCKAIGLSVVDDIQDKWDESDQYRVPFIDLDSDGFGSLTGGLRGTWWKGKDCSDIDNNVYPGQQPLSGDKYFDSNCNGIKGIDSEGTFLEDKYCKDYQPRGIAILGDSATAHFSIPENWFRASTFNETTFTNLFLALSNELDWPMLTWVTGFSENCWQQDVWSHTSKQVDSIYLRYLERNRCVYNDFQTQAKNGGASDNVASRLGMSFW